MALTGRSIVEREPRSPRHDGGPCRHERSNRVAVRLIPVLEHISLGLNRGDSQRIVNERVCRH
jgi:hypothetical protein